MFPSQFSRTTASPGRYCNQGGADCLGCRSFLRFEPSDGRGMAISGLENSPRRLLHTKRTCCSITIIWRSPSSLRDARRLVRWTREQKAPIYCASLRCNFRPPCCRVRRAQPKSAGSGGAESYESVTLPGGIHAVLRSQDVLMKRSIRSYIGNFGLDIFQQGRAFKFDVTAMRLELEAAR